MAALGAVPSVHVGVPSVGRVRSGKKTLKKRGGKKRGKVKAMQRLSERLPPANIPASSSRRRVFAVQHVGWRARQVRAQLEPVDVCETLVDQRCGATPNPGVFILPPLPLSSLGTFFFFFLGNFCLSRPQTSAAFFRIAWAPWRAPVVRAETTPSPFYRASSGYDSPTHLRFVRSRRRRVRGRW